MKAIELDDQYIKAYTLNGQSLMELGRVDGDCLRIDKGLGRLRKALSLCVNLKNKQFEPYIEHLIKQAEDLKRHKEKELE
eukprot:CAMPEP_0170557686 /NCGR_PEP_ID=MMETSP0211-20121228/29340_1 /TAXON_ID=311385 /ORGANISM="Pseudokeronopsis sp., Strain OXSARD2" /LENGTH=79 /DNA_ID=CAMNT_0010868925 /DNA_START=186 /DNA_END=425 /DNA_ORIENTATION=-